MEVFLYHAFWMIVSFALVYWMMGGPMGRAMGGSEPVLYTTVGGVILGIATKSVVPVYLGIWFIPLGLGYILHALLSSVFSDK